jgi:hypothetical protein
MPSPADDEEIAWLDEFMRDEGECSGRSAPIAEPV